MKFQSTLKGIFPLSVIFTLLFVMFVVSAQAQPSTSDIFKLAEDKIEGQSEDLGLGRPDGADIFKRANDKIDEVTGRLFNGEQPMDQSNVQEMTDMQMEMAMDDANTVMKNMDQQMQEQMDEVFQQQDQAGSQPVSGSVNVEENANNNITADPRPEYPFFDFEVVDPEKAVNTSTNSVGNAVSSVFGNSQAAQGANTQDVTSQSQGAIQTAFGGLGIAINSNSNKTSAPPSVNNSIQNSAPVTTNTSLPAAVNVSNTLNNSVNNNVTGVASSALGQTSFIFNK